VPSGTITVDARQPFLPNFPCSRCHAPGAANPTERVLTEFHTQKVLNHGTQGGWCYRCHGKDDIDKLHLSDGTLVGFDQSYELCGSCHGDKLRDWKAGLHGLTTGYWLGDRQRRSCPACHDPHQPRFPQMTPEHAPALPRTVTAAPHSDKAQGEHDDEAH
jgi:formate-dependent nitrite reductase cytochrome c552 subunit